MSNSHFRPEYRFGTVIILVYQRLCQPAFTFETSRVGFHGELANTQLLIFARAPDCIQYQNATSEGQHLLSEF